MQSLLLAFLLLLTLRVLISRKFAHPSDANLGIAIKHELSAWLLTAAILLGVYVVAFAVALAFGPIPQVHEW